MIQVDIPAAFTLGHFLAFLGRKYLVREPDIWKNKMLGPLNLYMSCGFAPGGMFLLVGWPAWEAMYVTAWLENPFNRPLVAAFYVLFMIVMVLLGNLGFILAHGWYRKGRPRWVAAGCFIGLALTLLPFVLKWGVWWRVGTYEAVQAAGGGYSFFQPPFFWGWMGIMGYLLVTTLWAAWWFHKKGALL